MPSQAKLTCLILSRVDICKPETDDLISDCQLACVALEGPIGPAPGCSLGACGVDQLDGGILETARGECNPDVLP